MAEVALLAGGHPLLLGHRGRPGRLLDEPAGQAGEPAADAPQLADVHRGRRIGVADQVGPLQLAEEVSDPRVGRPLVMDPGQQRHLVAAVRAPAAGHEGLLVPPQERRARGQESQLPSAPDQFIVGGFRVHQDLSWSGAAGSVCHVSFRFPPAMLGNRGPARKECAGGAARFNFSLQLAYRLHYPLHFARIEGSHATMWRVSVRGPSRPSADSVGRNSFHHFEPGPLESGRPRNKWCSSEWGPSAEHKIRSWKSRLAITNRRRHCSAASKCGHHGPVDQSRWTMGRSTAGTKHELPKTRSDVIVADSSGIERGESVRRAPDEGEVPGSSSLSW